MKKRRLRLFLLFMSFALILSGGTMVLAQEDTGKDSKNSDEFLLEEVIITGSRIAREEGFGQISPVTVLGAEDISSYGFTRIEDVLNTLPQIQYEQNASWSNGASGTAAIDLRGLAPERTLVLFNGRRMQSGGTWSPNTPDVNQVPSAMVERVEVLTGGASAIYGPDAVAGVVNFIMRKVDGLEISVGASAYQHDNSNDYMRGLMDEAGYTYPTGDTGFDGRAYDLSVIAGGDFADGRGNATVYATWRDNDQLLAGERDYSACALDATGTYCGGSANAIVPNFFIAPMSPDSPDGGADWDNYSFVTLQPDGSLADFVDNFYNYAPINSIQRPDERYSAGAFLDYEINEKATAYMEVQYFSDHTIGQGAESGTFFAYDYILPRDNSLFPAAFQASLEDMYPGQEWFAFEIGKRNVEGGPRMEVYDHNSFRLVGGIKGAINDSWDYDVSYLKGQTASTDTYLNDFYGTPIFTAVDGEACAADANCIPYEVFTYGGVTPEAAAALGGVGIASTSTSIQVVSGVVSGDTGFGLSAGNIFVVGGLEYREEDYDRIMDTVYEQYLLLGQGGPIPSLAGEFKVKEAFGEISIPLLSDMPGAKDLTLNLAARLTDHSMTGTDWTYRAGLDWHANDMLRIRTGYNRAVRSPNVWELFNAQNVSLWTGVDPCAGSDPLYTQEQCARTGVTAAQYGSVPLSPASQYNFLDGGNPNLQPEQADTITFGVVVKPQENLNLSLDYWNIEIDDTIDSVGASLIIDLCALNGQLCELIHRGGAGNLWIGQDPYVEDTQQNIGSQRFDGIDVAASYWLDALEGSWNFNIIGTYMMTKETTPIAGDDSTKYDCVGIINLECIPTPKWRHTASLTYDSHESWTGMLRWRYYTRVDYDGDVDEIINLKPTSYFDLNAVYKFGEKHDIVIGINNVFDKEPPLVGDSFSLPPHGNMNTLAGFYDTLGRYLYAKATFRF